MYAIAAIIDSLMMSVNLNYIAILKIKNANYHYKKINIKSKFEAGKL